MSVVSLPPGTEKAFGLRMSRSSLDCKTRSYTSPLQQQTEDSSSAIRLVVFIHVFLILIPVFTLVLILPSSHSTSLPSSHPTYIPSYLDLIPVLTRSHPTFDPI